MILSRRFFWLASGALACLITLAVFHFFTQHSFEITSPWFPASLALMVAGGVLLAAVLLVQARIPSALKQEGGAARRTCLAGDPARRLPPPGSSQPSESVESRDRVRRELEETREILRRASAETESLRCTTMLSRQLLDRLPVPHALCELHSGRFCEVNQALLALLGGRREEVVGRTDRELDLWVDPHARESWWELVREKQSVRDVECQLRTRSGQLRHVVLSAEVIPCGEVPRALVTVHDLTDRLARELRVRQTQKMEAVGRLAAGFAHDFNNILCVIQGYANLLASDPRLESQHQAFLQQVVQAAERGAQLTRQLLVFSRKQVHKPATVSLNQLLQGLSSMVDRMLGDEFSLKLELGAETPPVSVDTGMLEQLVMNLAMNARDAMSRGGVLTLRTAFRTIDPDYTRLVPEARAGEFVVLTVSDTGCGMEAATLSRLFEPFFSTKDVGKGAGMGLATVYGIVRQHQGWIEVSSQPGRGSAFDIFLPASAAGVEPSAAKPAPARLEGSEKVLVVEDEPGLLALVLSVLGRYGYEVFSAPNGVEALKVWQTHRDHVDLLVTDMVMPEGVTGRELGEKLRRDKPGLKIIYTSGYSADLLGVTDEELVEGCNFIQKPYQPEILVQTVRNRLDQGGPAKGRATQQAAA